MRGVNPFGDSEHNGMLGKLVAVARNRGIARIYGDVLATNRRMTGLLRALGFRLGRHPEDPTLTRATLELG